MTGKRKHKGAFCPGCERYIGPVDVCPYCECDSGRNPVYRVLRYGAFVLAVGGLVFLHVMAGRSGIPRVSVCDIHPTMNFGVVAVSGAVVRAAYREARSGVTHSVSFMVDDGSGCVKVVAYGAVAEGLVREGRLPGRGMVVEVTGSVSCSADGKVRLVVRRSGDLRVGR